MAFLPRECGGVVSQCSQIRALFTLGLCLRGRDGAEFDQRTQREPHLREGIVGGKSDVTLSPDSAYTPNPAALTYLGESLSPGPLVSGPDRHTVSAPRGTNCQPRPTTRRADHPASTTPTNGLVG